VTGDGPPRRARMRLPWWGWAAMLAVLAVAVNAASCAVQASASRSRLLPGLEIVRPPHEVRALALSGTTLFAGGRDGLFAVDTRTLRVTRPVPATHLPLGQVRGLALDADGTLWVAHETGLSALRGAGVRTYTRADGLPADRCTAVMRAGDGRLWVGTDRGAAWMDGERFHAVTAKDGLVADDVNALGEDSRGGIWFGSYVAPRGGVSVLRDGAWRRFTTVDGLPHADVTCFLPDGDGGMWVGTGFNDRGGAARFETTPDGGLRIAETRGAKDGLAGEKVRALYRDPAGRVWFGSERDGLAVPGAAGYRVITTAEGLSDNEVKAFAKGSGGVLWLGTRSGITLVRDAQKIAPR